MIIIIKQINVFKFNYKYEYNYFDYVSVSVINKIKIVK